MKNLGMVLVVSLCAVWLGWGFAGEKDPVAYWKFDEGKGEITKDVSGRKASLLGAEWFAKGKSGSAVKLNGDDAYVEVTNSEDFDQEKKIKTAVTFTLWVMWDGILGKADESKDFSAILMHGNYGGCSYGVLMGRSEGGTAGGLGFYVNSNGKPAVDGGIPLMQANKWYHLAFVYDGKEAKIYVNGEENVSAPLTIGEFNAVEVPLTIGGQATGQRYSWSGCIDEVKIYNYALSDKEVKDDCAAIK